MTTASGGRGDLGRRAALRRRQLGLSQEEVAARAGMAPAYVRYLEEQSVTPGVGSLLRLAGALETSAAALRGEGTDLPPGLGREARHPELLEMDPGECRSRLATHGVGRIAVCEDGAPAVLPVNYSVVDGTVAFRTAPGSVPDRAAGQRVAFEVDHIDEALSQGWSVLLVGTARRVTDPATVRHLGARAHSGPWAGGDRPQWLCIDAERVTGRRVRTP
ncbi:helix-turn-helix domain-containing protein [Streptomyces sp. NBC_01803]|uniref:helix-turn-helix domain-containing protein n=1 Tax=Streptomyces sp. NBC_01803 TaxID=2975946 RepID=UPI002DDB36B6|nr:pyridoxamine 5'-phosphate oxidase family protein [Streptomyces sp. NBC_01803]WSA47361.1 pyridoxamine 5'-phosphate oxidase family protein [Streptomyces sp. NBC_01803]